MPRYYSYVDTAVGLGSTTVDDMINSGSEYGVVPSIDIVARNIIATGTFIGTLGNAHNRFADITVTGIATCGIVTGATYYGDGSNLTGVGGNGITLNGNYGSGGSMPLSGMTGLVKFDNDYSDVARGPNKVLTYNDGTSWISGIGVHNANAAYYSGANHRWYVSNSQTSFTEVMSLSSVGFLGTGSQGTLWGSSNDGAGSGLDADTLDGIQASSFLRSDTDDNAQGFGSRANINSTGDPGLFILNGSRLGFDQSGTRSWNIKASGGNLNVASGDGNNFMTGQINASRFDNLQSSQFLRSDADDSYSGNLTINGFIAPTGTNVVNNLRLRGSTTAGTDVGVSLYTGSNTWALQLYGHAHASTPSYGFLNGNWQGWDLRKYIDGQLQLRVGGSDYNVWHAGNDGSGSGLDADLLDGIQASSFLRSDQKTTITTSTDEHLVLAGSNAPYIRFQSGTTNKAYLQYDLSSNSIYLWNSDSNTGLRLTGSNAQFYDGSGYRTLWNDANDGAGSGLDADTLDGVQASSFMRSDSSSSSSGSINFTNSYYAFGNGTGSVSNNGNWNARVNIAGSSHARLDLVSNSDGIVTTVYSHTGHAAGKVGTTSNHSLKLMTNGNDRATLTTAGSLSTTVQGTLWGASNDGSGSGLDADTLDGYHAETGGRNENADKVVTTDGNGYLLTGWINTTSGDNSNAIPNRMYCSDDGYIRYVDLASFRSLMNVTTKTGYQGREQSTTDSNYWVGTMGWSSNDFNDVFHYGSGSIEGWSTPGNSPSSETSHWVGHQSLHYTNGSSSAYGHQIMVGAGNPAYHYIRGRWGASFTGWSKIWNSSNDGAGSGLDADNLDGYTWDSSGKTVRGDDVYCAGWFRNDSSGEGVYNQATGMHWYSDSSNYWNLGSGQGAHGIRFRDNHAGTVRGYVYATNSNEIGFLNNSGSWSWRMDSSGNGTASGNVSAYSDINLKENIEVIPNALDKVSSIRGVSFNRIDIEGNPRQSGVIAQEVEKILPEVVSTNEEGVKSVAYGNLVGLLVEAIKEQKSQMDEMRNEIQTLKSSL